MFFFREKTGWVDLPVLINSFEYKKDLEKELNYFQVKHKKSIDSIDVKLNYLAQKLSLSYDQKLIEDYEQIKQNREITIKTSEQQLYNFALKSDSLILHLINKYIQEFGTNNGYSYIYGAKANGILMYGSKEKDLTEELINHINKAHNEINN